MRHRLRATQRILTLFNKHVRSRLQIPVDVIDCASVVFSIEQHAFAPSSIREADDDHMYVGLIIRLAVPHERLPGEVDGDALLE